MDREEEGKGQARFGRGSRASSAEKADILVGESDPWLRLLDLVKDDPFSKYLDEEVPDLGSDRRSVAARRLESGDFDGSLRPSNDFVFENPFSSDAEPVSTGASFSDARSALEEPDLEGSGLSDSESGYEANDLNYDKSAKGAAPFFSEGPSFSESLSEINRAHMQPRNEYSSDVRYGDPDVSSDCGREEGRGLSHDDSSSFDPHLFSGPEFHDSDHGLDRSQSVAPSPPRRRGIFFLGILFVLFLFSGGTYFYFQSGRGGLLESRELPVVHAVAAPVKLVPKDPGGTKIPNQNKLIYDRVVGRQSEVEEKLVSREEEPVDMSETVGESSVRTEDGFGVSAQNFGAEEKKFEERETATFFVRNIKIKRDEESSGANSRGLKEVSSRRPHTDSRTDSRTDDNVRSVMERDETDQDQRIATVQSSSAPSFSTTEDNFLKTDKSSSLSSVQILKPRRVRAVVLMPKNMNERRNLNLTPRASGDNERDADVSPLPSPRPSQSFQGTEDQSFSSSENTVPPYGEPQYVVQLAARRSEQMAMDAYKMMKELYPSLHNHEPSIERVNLGEQGLYYRLRVGPLRSLQDAGQLCELLKNEGLSDCLVRRISLSP
ncbi:MAG: SPOR domain-containing protein [Alphaproteobacteria bacterium]|nr:SPOR domain-containing protein [Alphaproteobacteria bacterium]